MNNSLGYTNLTASTIEPNSSYLYCKNIPVTSDPISGSTMGFMALLSVLQYQAPYMGPEYSRAATAAGRAAFIESGGQAFQEKLVGVATKNGLETIHSVGVTDGELGFIAGTVKTIKDRQLTIKGPKIRGIGSNLTVTPNSSNITLNWSW